MAEVSTRQVKAEEVFMFMEPDDHRVDAELRRVAMPAELKDRLRQIGTCSDADLDAELRHVALPSKLRDRLLAIGTLSDIDLDAELQHVPVVESGRRTKEYLAQHGRGWRTPARVALAASLLLAATLGYFAVRAIFFGPAAPMVAGQPGDLVKPANDELRDDGWDLPPRDEFSPMPMAEGLVEGNSLLRGFDQSQRKTALDLLEQLQTPDNLPLFDLSNHSNEPREKAWEKVLGAPLLATPDPRFEPGVGRMVVRGLAPPRAKGYDLIFQLKHGVHPFVYPWSDKDLIVSRVPLVTETASFDLVREALAERRLPAPQEVRVEDFLAAMTYGFAPPRRDALKLSVAGGPAPFGTSGANLLQIGVQAKTLQRAKSASSLVLVIDLSDGMRWDGGWNAARRAVRAMIDRMGADDRLTLIVFDDRGRKLLDRADRERAKSFAASLETMSPKGIPNLAAGVELGLDAAEAELAAAMDDAESSTARSTTLALIAADPIEVPAERIAAIENRLKQFASGGAEFRLIDVSGEAEPPQQLAQLAKSARGKIHRPSASGDVRAALMETLTHEPQRVAGRATLRVRFSPKGVAAYRLLGHEATVPAGVIAPPLEVDLFSGDTATALYEVVLKPDGPDDVAVARLDWIDAQTGQAHRKELKITRSDFAAAFRDAPESLQIAALAAEAAELLRGSYFAPPHTHSLTGLAEVAERQTSPELREQPAYQTLLELVEKARRARGSSR